MVDKKTIENRGETAHNRALMPVICGLVCLTAFAVDLSLPAIPLITQAFGVSEGNGQYIISVFVLGFGIGQLFWGAFSDMFGRRPVLIAGLLAFISIGYLSSQADDFELLILLRFLHGLTAGVGPVIGRAIVRDISSGAETVRILTLVTSILGLAPLFAPLIGSGLLTFGPWEYTFHAVTIFALILGLGVWFFVPETNPPDARGYRFSWGFWGKIGQTSREIFGIRSNLIPVLLVAVPFGGYYAILTGSPIVLSDVYDYPPTMFGVMFAIVAMFWFISAILARRLLPKYGLAFLKKLATGLLFIAGAGSFSSVYFEGGFVLFWAMCALYLAGVGIMMPVATASALEPFAHAAGTAASLIGCVQMAVGAFSAIMVGYFYDSSALSVASAMFIMSIISAILFRLGKA